MTIDTNTLKQRAAASAVKLIKDGMVVGLGSGSTANYAIKAIAERVANGLNIVAIPTSEESKRLAEQNGIPLTSFAQHQAIDLTIDGADQVEHQSLNLIKGLGGALLREKIVAYASKKLIIIVDERKLVPILGNQSPLPVEIIPFGHEVIRRRIIDYCPTAELRIDQKGKPVITDSGNYILDCQIARIEKPAELAKNIKLLPGVVETGLFIDLTSEVIVSTQKGITTLRRK